jgi:hypothetical protein
MPGVQHASDALLRVAGWETLSAERVDGREMRPELMAVR